ncbi:MAG TPA: hypothetical protein VF190_01720, partial [Rhodothermales bacterium]
IVLALACALWAGGLRTRGMKRSIIGALCLAVLATCVYVSVSYAIFRSGATGEPSYTIAPVTNFLIERGESGRSFVATMVKLALETVQRDSFPGSSSSCRWCWCSSASAGTEATGTRTSCCCFCCSASPLGAGAPSK